MIKPPPLPFSAQTEYLDLTLKDLRGRRLTALEKARLQNLEDMRSLDSRIDDLDFRLTRLDNKGN
jgi:hypothetical protein